MKEIAWETVKRWRLPLVCCAWMLGLVALLPGRRYESFLSLQFLPIIILAAAAFLLLALLSLVRRTPPPLGGGELLKTAIILLPLVYIYHAGGAFLGANAFNTRYIAQGYSGKTSVEAAVASGDGETSLLNVFMNSSGYEGKKVTVVGMLSKDNPQVTEIIGESTPLLFRFVINCCAADAIPLALLLEGGVDANMENDQWIEASGTLRLRTSESYEVLALEDATVRVTQKPREPYLYMLWGVL